MEASFAALLAADEEDDGPVYRFQGEWEHPDDCELVPYDQAYAALTEFLVTGSRPTNITWDDI